MSAIERQAADMAAELRKWKARAEKAERERNELLVWLDTDTAAFEALMHRIERAEGALAAAPSGGGRVCGADLTKVSADHPVKWLRDCVSVEIALTREQYDAAFPEGVVIGAEVGITRHAEDER